MDAGTLRLDLRLPVRQLRPAARVAGGQPELPGFSGGALRQPEAGGRLYFTVTGDGKPLRQRRYCHSENFYTMANAEYYAQTGDTVRMSGPAGPMTWCTS